MHTALPESSVSQQNIPFTEHPNCEDHDETYCVLYCVFRRRRETLPTQPESKVSKTVVSTTFNTINGAVLHDWRVYELPSRLGQLMHLMRDVVTLSVRVQFLAGLEDGPVSK